VVGTAVGRERNGAGDVKIEIAENILLKGIEQNVQSTYLQLQYVIFMAAYKGNFEQSKIRCAIRPRRAGTRCR
jgi:hypothetical protein